MTGTTNKWCFRLRQWWCGIRGHGGITQMHGHWWRCKRCHGFINLNRGAE